MGKCYSMFTYCFRPQEIFEGVDPRRQEQIRLFSRERRRIMNIHRRIRENDDIDSIIEIMNEDNGRRRSYSDCYYVSEEEASPIDYIPIRS